MNDSFETQRIPARQYILIALFALAIALMSAFVGCSQATSGGSSGSSAAAISVNLKADATDYDAGILYDGDISLNEGASVYDALIESGLDLDVGSMSGSVYIDGISGIVASKVSPISGWLYTVNGKMPSVAADAYTLEDGDEVVWTFYKDALSKAED